MLFEAALWCKAKVILDVLGEGIIDLTVTWNRLLLPSRRVDVNIMPGTVPVKSATLLNELPDKLHALHKASSFV